MTGLPDADSIQAYIEQFNLHGDEVEMFMQIVDDNPADSLLELQEDPTATTEAMERLQNALNQTVNYPGLSAAVRAFFLASLAEAGWQESDIQLS